jgi:hypothetical protein
MFKRKPKKEIRISKFLDDLPGTEDVITDARSYSPERLKDVCNNIKFDASQEIDPIENITIQFIFRNFFYMMHQTGLYNPQRRLFNHIASVEKVEVKDFTKLTKTQQEAGKISDLYFYDANGRYLLLRLEHPSSDLDFVALPKLFSDANKERCIGAIYISNKMPSEPIMEMIRSKTSYKNPMERYRSPINDHASFNFLIYQASPSSVVYRLVHPDLAKGESATATVPAELIKAFYDNSATLVG